MSIQFKAGYVEKHGDRLFINYDGRSMSMTLEQWMEAGRNKIVKDEIAAFNKAASEVLQKSVDDATLNNTKPTQSDMQKIVNV